MDFIRMHKKHFPILQTVMITKSQTKVRNLRKGLEVIVTMPRTQDTVRTKTLRTTGEITPVAPGIGTTTFRSHGDTMTHARPEIKDNQTNLHMGYQRPDGTPMEIQTCAGEEWGMLIETPDQPNYGKTPSTTITPGPAMVVVVMMMTMTLKTLVMTER